MHFSKNLTKKEQTFLRDDLRLVVSENLAQSPFVGRLREALAAVESPLIFKKMEADNVLLIKTRSNDIFDSQEISLRSVIQKYNDSKELGQFSNRLCVVYLSSEDTEISPAALRNKLSDFCKLKDTVDTKVLFLFEKVEEKIKALALEHQAGDVISLGDFRDLIFDLQFEHRVEFEHSESVASSVDLIVAFISIFCKKRNAVHSDLNPLDSVKISDNSKSKILGVENDLCLMWVS